MMIDQVRIRAIRGKTIPVALLVSIGPDPPVSIPQGLASLETHAALLLAVLALHVAILRHPLERDRIEQLLDVAILRGEVQQPQHAAPVDQKAEAHRDVAAVALRRVA